MSARPANSRLMLEKHFFLSPFPFRSPNVAVPFSAGRGRSPATGYAHGRENSWMHPRASRLTKLPRARQSRKRSAVRPGEAQSTGSTEHHLQQLLLRFLASSRKLLRRPLFLSLHSPSNTFPLYSFPPRPPSSLPLSESTLPGMLFASITALNAQVAVRM